MLVLMVTGRSVQFFFHHQPADAARRIAAGIDFAAIGIVNAHEDIRRFGRLHDNHLVAAFRDKIMTRSDFLHLLRGQVNGVPACIENDKVIPRAMHFYKRNGHKPGIIAAIFLKAMADIEFKQLPCRQLVAVHVLVYRNFHITIYPEASCIDLDAG